MLVNLTLELKTKQKNTEIIITGDFNADENENTIQLLNSNFLNTFSRSKIKPFGSEGTWNAFDFKTLPKNRIDYIFLNKNTKLEVKKFITINYFYDFKYPSDHLPIMATFSTKLTN